MSTKKPRSPQEKKTLSYAHDRRNSFYENDKASRQAIPARKAGENRRARRKAGHALDVIERVSEEQADILESSIRHAIERVGGWQKGSDVPLSEHIAQQARRRSRRGHEPSLASSE